MPTRSGRGGTTVAACLAAVAAALALSAPAAARAPEAADAGAALARALAIFGPADARALRANAARPDPRGATMALRDLAARMHELDARERALARRLLARPTDPARDGALALEYGRTPARHVCDATMCYWWVATGRHAPPLADRNRNRIPDWVETTRRTMQTAWRTEVGRFGFRRPLSDVRARNHGPNGKLDIYLGDVGVNGVYGYCAPDDPALRTRRAVAAYCVLDDDFSRRQFPGGANGVRALKVTAAHEFFHAVQFAYDWAEDRWLMEGTATWMEDEVFPAIDDNFQYLRTSPLSASDFWLPLDVWEPRIGRAGAGHEYGAWVFWRYLSERFGRNAVRGVLARASGGPYAIQATAAELAARGAALRAVLADFAVANFLPGASYRRGAVYASRPGVGPRPSRVFQLTAAAPDTGRRIASVPHMASDYYAFTPAADLPPGSRLTVEVDLPGAETSPGASVLVLKPGGVVERTAIALDANGVGSLTAAEFAGGGVTTAVLVLTNASTRFAGCRRDKAPPFFSCFGTPLDDLEYSFRAFAGP